MVDDSDPRVHRRSVLKIAGASGMVSIAGCLSGEDNGDGNPSYPHTIWGMYGSWEEAYVQGGEFYAEDQGFNFENNNAQGEEEEQISHIQSFMQQGADGILVGPVSATSPASSVEQAVSQDIPVIAANSAIETPDLTMSVYVGNEPACEKLSVEIVNYLESGVDPEGGVEGTVVNLQGDLGMAIGTEREQGFRNAVDGHDGIDVLEISADFNRTPAQEGLYSVLQSEGGDIDAIFAANGAMAAGAAEALNTYGIGPGEVFIACMDGSPTVLGLFDDEWLQRAFTQPTQYYLPIALHYLELVRTEGEDALPDVDDEIDTDDLEITGEEHMGVNIWEGQDWAPATVQERNGHPWFQTSGRLLTPENYDKSSNWGVIFGEEN